MRIYLRYLLFRVLIALCDLLPQRFLYFAALRLADLNYYWLDRRGGRAVEDNLRVVLPEASPERLAKEARWVFRNFAKYLTEFFRFRHFGPAFFRTNMAMFGLEHIEAALAAGRGCVVSSAHLSNWELGAAGLSIMEGKKMTVSVAMHRYGRINDLFMRERERMGLRVADMERDAARALLRALRRNEVVGVMGDRDPTEQGVIIRFFGRPCRFPQGPARLSLATGAPLVPAFCLRRSNDSFSCVFHPPIPIPAAGDRAEKVCRMTQAFADVIAETIRLHPEQWAVFYPFWEGNWRPE
ncbi:MAG: lysophospholipid acyltransferase family protein [Planctomycetota bacterium]|jgi:KDO2-lipid IV(A) lauroyltransferase|nr:lysophospholipid acyltransferase family protein [Planctomycetota bacterium]